MEARIKYSVLMSVYLNDRPDWFRDAVISMVRQSYKPEEIIIIQDGPVSAEIECVENELVNAYPELIRIEKLPVNVGLGQAMAIGVEKCRNEWIARMDADDVADEYRCENEIIAAIENDADIVGCDCEEFIGEINNKVSDRRFPEKHKDIISFSRKRTPFCHPAVLMKKTAVLRAGNYQNKYLYEDYDLFVRMLASGSVGYNVKRVLYHIRVSEDFYSRRGGLKYVFNLVRFNIHLLHTGWMSKMDFIVRTGGNILVGLAPACVRQFFYRRFLRK